MTPSEWNRFTEQFTKESDPEKLRSLMDEMNRALANERLGRQSSDTLAVTGSLTASDFIRHSRFRARPS
jgi:hypothetical protein